MREVAMVSSLGSSRLGMSLRVAKPATESGGTAEAATTSSVTQLGDASKSATKGTSRAGRVGGGAEAGGATSSTSSATATQDPADTNGDGKVSDVERTAYTLKQQLKQYTPTGAVSAEASPKGLVKVLA